MTFIPPQQGSVSTPPPRGTVVLKGEVPVTLQIVGQKCLDRKEHVWIFRERNNRPWKCVLCGAVSHKKPPDFERGDWMPDAYEPLSDEERKLCPNPGIHNFWGTDEGPLDEEPV